MTMPATVSTHAIAECVRRADGVILTGGDDVNPELYSPDIKRSLGAKVKQTQDDGERDLRELVLVDEVFRQRKPLLAICRGHQVLNVALGGTLFADIPSQIPRAINHQQTERKFEIVHDAHLTPDSLLSKITQTQTLGVNSTHHQAVDKPAGILEVVARGSDGVVEAMQLKAGARRTLPFLLSVQFHPERLVDRYPQHLAIFAVFAQACVLNVKKQI